MTESWRLRLRTRTLLFTALFACLFLVLIGRLAHLQIARHDELLRLAERQHSKAVALRPQRGLIFDRHGQPLAISSATESLYALPPRIDDAPGLARALAPLLEEPPGELRKRLAADRPFVWVKRKLPPPVAQKIRALRAPGLGFVEESARFYPNRELAAHVLGFEGVDSRGLEGIEYAYESHLAGQSGLALVERDALGRGASGAPTVVKPATPGKSVVLTLDATIQYLAEKEIEAAWRRTLARSAMAVVLDTRTGELLALAIRPTFNPNRIAAATPHQWRNRAVTDPFEPGSTFKAILAAAALEEGVVRPADLFYGEQGAITVASTVIRDWKPYGWLTFSEVLQHSSNVGAIKVGLALGRERYARYIAAFGFGSLTGLGLPGESRGQVRPPERWSGLSLAAMSMGQELSVTALQMVSAFAAVANGGRLLQPQIVREVWDAQGREVGGFKPRLVRQVISPETARTLTKLLTRVVSEGTGARAAIAGHAVAGKTGTAQKLDPATGRYSRTKSVLSFVGFAPADEPRIAMLVLLDEPQTAQWGSEAAAPIFARIGEEVLRYLNVPSQESHPVQIVSGADAAKGAGPRAGDPRRVPEPEAWVRGSVGAGSAVVIPAGGWVGSPEPTMPNLIGRSFREALATLSAYDVHVEVSGRGIVVAQQPSAGLQIQPGIVCRLDLAPPTASQ